MMMSWHFCRPLAVAEMSCIMNLSIRETAFDPEAELASFRHQLGNIGALTSFTGLVRDMTDTDGSGVPGAALNLEHYPAMTLRNIEEFAQAVAGRWSLDGLLALHRVGSLRVSEPIVLVAAASAHRRAAFEASDCMMDYLKAKALFWKSETIGTKTRWIEPTQRDYEDSERWDQ